MSTKTTSQTVKKYENSTDRNLEIINLFGLLGGGVIIKILFNNQGPANASIFGYGLSAIATFLLVVITFAFNTPYNSAETQENPDTLSNNFNLMIPPFLLLIVLVWSIILNISNFKQVNKSNLPKEFGMYSFLSSFLIIVQIISLFIYFNREFGLLFFINKASSREKGELKIEDAKIIQYVLFIFNVIILGMMQIVLEFFTTDG